MQREPPILQPCQAENVFYKSMEPVRVLVDPVRKGVPGIRFICHIHNHFAGAHDPCQGRARVMGNCPQEIAPVAFLRRFLPGPDPLLHHPQPVHSHGRAFEHGMKQRLLLVCQRLSPFFGNAQNAKDRLTSVNGPVIEFLTHNIACPQVLNPVLKLSRIGNTSPDLLCFRFLLDKCALRFSLFIKTEAGGPAVHNAADCFHHDPRNLICAFRIRQVTGQVIQRAGLLPLTHSFRCHFLCFGSQGAGDDRGDCHDGKGYKIGRIIYGQRIIGMGKKDIEGTGGKNCCKNAPDISLRKSGCQNDGQNVDNHNVGLRKLKQPEQPSDSGCQTNKYCRAKQSLAYLFPADFYPVHHQECPLLSGITLWKL